MNAFRRFFIRWYYRRLFRKLFWYYAAKNKSSYQALEEAKFAFVWFTGDEWEEWLF